MRTLAFVGLLNSVYVDWVQKLIVNYNKSLCRWVLTVYSKTLAFVSDHGVRVATACKNCLKKLKSYGFLTHIWQL